MGDAIIIENDGLYESVEYTPAKLSDLSKEDILKRIQEGGVVGQGGAGFPTVLMGDFASAATADYLAFAVSGEVRILIRPADGEPEKLFRSRCE